MMTRQRKEWESVTDHFSGMLDMMENGDMGIDYQHPRLKWWINKVSRTLRNALDELEQEAEHYGAPPVRGPKVESNIKRVVERMLDMFVYMGDDDE